MQQMRKRERTLMVALFFVVAGLGGGATGGGAQKIAATANGFKVDIDGIPSAMFTSVKGIGVVNEATEFKGGGSNDVRLVPGHTKFPYLELSRRATGTRELFDWAMSNLNGKIVRKTVTVSMLNVQGAVVAKWTFNGAWPVKWDGPDFDASSKEIVIETIHLAYDSLVMSTDGK